MADEGDDAVVKGRVHFGYYWFIIKKLLNVKLPMVPSNMLLYYIATLHFHIIVLNLNTAQ